MNAYPRVTESYRQEYLKGEAEDMYWVIAKNQTIKVPQGTYHNAVPHGLRFSAGRSWGAQRSGHSRSGE